MQEFLEKKLEQMASVWKVNLAIWFRLSKTAARPNNSWTQNKIQRPDEREWYAWPISEIAFRI